MEDIEETRKLLLTELSSVEDPRAVLRSRKLRQLYLQIPRQEPDQRARFGQEVNQLKKELEQAVNEKLSQNQSDNILEIDVTAPFDSSPNKPQLLPAENGTIHPLYQELEKVLEIFSGMGFDALESRQIDDDWHMFTSLNFPEDHPARDDWDTFITEEELIAPAHTSTMQNRVIFSRRHLLEQGQNISVVVPGRTFRNEDVDARHEHTFLQVEGVFVGEKITVGNLVETFKAFLRNYYQDDSIKVKITPFYFPFTEPSFEFSLSCPFCHSQGCSICSFEGWIELMGMGMIHPNVLKLAEVDPTRYTGFAWGFGLDRLVMMKNNIEDIRHFNSGKLAFLRQFGGV